MNMKMFKTKKSIYEIYKYLNWFYVCKNTKSAYW